MCEKGNKSTPIIFLKKKIENKMSEKNEEEEEDR